MSAIGFAASGGCQYLVGRKRCFGDVSVGHKQPHETSRTGDVNTRIKTIDNVHGHRQDLISIVGYGMFVPDYA